MNLNSPPSDSDIPETFGSSAMRSHQRRENRRTIQSAQLDTSEALDRFTKVVEMLHTNKVNKSNAFELRIMDYISEVFKGVEAQSKDTEFVWQKYSTGIDSCAKIYGYCVDFIHSETFRVLGGLNRTHAPEEEENDENNENQDENVEDKPKKKKKCPGGSSTLERSADAINTTKFEKSDDFDPYFRLMSARFDASSAEGLLINNLSINGAIELILGDDDRLDITEPLNQEPYLNLEGFFKSSYEELLEMDISPELSEFERVRLNGQPSGAGLEKILENMNAEYDLFEASGSEASLPEEGPQEQIDLADLADSIFKKKERDMSEAFHSDVNTANLIERLNNIEQRDDYRYFSNPKLGTWAGFEFWNRISNPNPNKPKSEKKIRKKKEPTEINLDYTTIANKEEVFAPPKRGYPNFYSDQALKKWEENSNSIPYDYGFSLFRLTQLFTRPQTQVKYLKQGLDFENVIVDNVDVPTSGEEGHEAEILFAEEIEPLPGEDYAQNLQFATTSKTIDIKRLKETMWHKLNTKTKMDIDDKENTRVIHDEKNNTFLGVLNALPGTLPQQEVSNLSVHSCFISLLHLANEHNLRLEATDECDFTIMEN
ncbi:unnamed protein product [Blepharisma stoltei]|uniref:Condensin complex subunit 2 n=1 Tax=Blepharisma stoltei TaxID=1481888 RepID=A0AAU9IFP7_9CILI|nr:unnamed protein product [Blepharisma stoltei]